MSNPADLVSKDNQPLKGTFFAKFAEDADDEESRVLVIIPSFDLTSPFGPCPWMPREGLLPQKDGPCWVTFDNDRQPVVMAWWPYD